MVRNAVMRRLKKSPVDRGRFGDGFRIPGETEIEIHSKRIHKGPKAMRETLIAEYHEMLAVDKGLTAQFFAHLKTMMRARRLLYGGREIE
jgi:hypothetical protein